MPTDPDKYYNLRDMTTISPMKGQEMFNGWFGKRTSGKRFYKQFRKNCSVFKGGENLDDYLKEHPDIKAYQVGRNEPNER